MADIISRLMTYTGVASPEPLQLVSNATTIPLHPYYPLELEINGFHANEWDMFTLCSLFASGCAVIFSVTYLVVKRVKPQVSVADLSTIMWFVLCTCHSTRPLVFFLGGSFVPPPPPTFLL